MIGDKQQRSDQGRCYSESNEHIKEQKVRFKDDDKLEELVIFSDNNKRHPLKSSFAKIRKINIQITWKNITIKAPPKAGMCKKIAPDAESVTILGKF